MSDLNREDIMLVMTTLLAIKYRDENYEDWPSIALHDAIKIMEEFSYHDELGSKDCERCNPDPKVTPPEAGK